ncbi:MAG: 23S rRNA (guanosine(2251)-2'-O)-methyltransferase RlmB [Clostridia bacterium]|nr:23S rRNA (guanosine(2251)-2'-O)-methyltransferase RlmB [Clostridia bacterium]
MYEDIIEGRNAVTAALKSGRQIDKIYVRRGDNKGSLVPIIAMAREKGVQVVETDKPKLDAMSETGVHQGVIARIPPYEYKSVDDILNIAREKGESPFIVILDHLEDPHNLGSIIRTANCAGVHGIIIAKHDGVTLTAAAVKASAGAASFTPVARVASIPQTIDKLKEEGIWVTGADAAGDRSIYQADLKGAVALVVGGEDKGISRLTAQKCDFLVSIPMKGDVNSLNASVAAALMIYETMKQR